MEKQLSNDNKVTKSNQSNMSFCKHHPSFPSLCIPHVAGHITEEGIWNLFQPLQLGDIAHIEVVSNRGKKDSRVIIHWNYWYDNRNAEDTRRRLLDGKDFPVFYHPERFWKSYQYLPSQVRRPSSIALKDTRCQEEEKRRKAAAALSRQEEEKRRKAAAALSRQEESVELTREEQHTLEVSYMVMMTTVEMHPPPITRTAKKLHAMTHSR
jgi:hypothetical protein